MRKGSVKSLDRTPLLWKHVKYVSEECKPTWSFFLLSPRSRNYNATRATSPREQTVHGNHGATDPTTVANNSTLKKKLYTRRKRQESGSSSDFKPKSIALGMHCAHPFLVNKSVPESRDVNTMKGANQKMMMQDTSYICIHHVIHHLYIITKCMFCEF